MSTFLLSDLVSVSVAESVEELGKLEIPTKADPPSDRRKTLWTSPWPSAHPNA